MDEVTTQTIAAVSAAGPIGWMALVTVAALAVAGFSIYAVMTVVAALKKKR